MKMFAASAIATAILAATPLMVLAQSEAPSARDMQGSPNAAGFGKDRGTAGTETKGGEQAPSAEDMKGPPNANGYGK